MNPDQSEASKVLHGEYRPLASLAGGRVLIRIGRLEIPFTRELYEDALQEQTWDELVASLPKEAE